MARFDHVYLEELMPRLRAIPEDAAPSWGAMSRAALYAHLADVVRFSMGQRPPMRDVSTWLSRNVIKRLLFAGIVKVPKNLKFPPPEAPNDAAVRDEPPADLERLEAVLREYLAAVETGAMQPARHPFLGPMTVDDWAVMHCLHCEHHLKQFGA